ncbi:hypothetical protein DAPPUDRAFT_236013 [Daphnia pulex]|uniref:Uncharacterized protein n=1 Tax=Daphnia pulex TaxID=6669 RepID=E9FZP2_DAPPU|nr:hypothetical protein DAPPUDRAFT_236013 [Daphnia pulex]|eukprot:EFX87233.1 hypothetical protein DAPPUDRAFT_236013 [Daphnia pulex]
MLVMNLAVSDLLLMFSLIPEAVYEASFVVDRGNLEISAVRFTLSLVSYQFITSLRPPTVAIAASVLETH